MTSTVLPQLSIKQDGTLDDCEARRAINHLKMGEWPADVLEIEVAALFREHPEWEAEKAVAQYAAKLIREQREFEKQPPDTSAPLADKLNFQFTLTDLGNAERLIEQYGGIIRYCYERKMWLIWQGTHWGWDQGATIMSFAQKVARNIYAEASQEDDDKKRENIVKWAKGSESNSRLNAMVEQAKPLVAVKVSDLDADRWLLNCQNGTVDLRTGSLREHSPDDLLTLLCPTTYEPDAQSALWDSFLADITDGNDNLISYLQRAIGYSLTGDTREQVFFFCHGRGANGKSTFLNTIRSLLGAYAMQIDPEIFMSIRNQGQQGHSENIANLVGKRLILGSEIEDGRRLAVTKMKQHTGGETIRASHKHEREFEFEVTYKIWLNGNHQPDVTDSTYSIWRRIKLIPFTVTIPPEKRDLHLTDTLTHKHGAAVFAWMIHGCLAWQRDGLSEPEKVKAATQQYHDEQDLLHDFLNVRCFTVRDAEVTILKKQLYAAYKTWCEESSIDAITQRTFNRKVAEKGYESFISSGQAKWRYIRLRTGNEVDEPVDEVDIVDVFTSSFLSREIHEKKPQTPESSSTVVPKIAESSSTLPSSSTVAESSSTVDLPDCLSCGCNEWMMRPDGMLVCPCGYQMQS